MYKESKKHVIVFGCSSGFGRAVSLHLLGENYRVTGISRSMPDDLSAYADFRHYQCDVCDEQALRRTLDDVVAASGTPGPFGTAQAGLVLNAGGPPPGSASELSLDDYRSAYRLVFEWKVQAVTRLLPELKRCGKGRIVFIESQSLKQPIPDLVLSNTMRLAVAGFAKTLSREVAHTGLTVNIIAPGSHNTPAIQRVIRHKAALQGLTESDTRRQMEQALPVGRFGEASELASLAGWLLSSDSSFVTGQTFSHDGGNISHIFG